MTDVEFTKLLKLDPTTIKLRDTLTSLNTTNSLNIKLSVTVPISLEWELQYRNNKFIPDELTMTDFSKYDNIKLIDGDSGDTVGSEDWIKLYGGHLYDELFNVAEDKIEDAIEKHRIKVNNTIDKIVKFIRDFAKKSGYSLRESEIPYFFHVVIAE